MKIEKPKFVEKTCLNPQSKLKEQKENRPSNEGL